MKEGAGAPDGIPELVAELAIADHALDVEVHVSALHGVGEHPESESVGTTLRDPVREVESLSLGGFLDLRTGGGGRVSRRERDKEKERDLAWREVPVLDLLDEGLQIAAGDHFLWVDDVPETLRHLAAVLVANHRVEIDCRRDEGKKEGGETAAPVLKGSLPVSCRPIMTMRATQKNKMSQPVSNSCQRQSRG
jgi:hypothetical protein